MPPVDRKSALVAVNLIGLLCGLCLAQNVSNAQPFSVTVPPDPFQVTVGSQIWTYLAAEVNADAGFTGTVQVAVSGVPSGVTVPQNPIPLVFATGGASRQSALFQFWASSAAAVGDTPLVFTASCNTDVDTVPATIRVNTFSINPDPDSRTMSKKGSTSYAFTVSPQNSFFGNLYFQVFGLPKGVTAAFNPQTVAVPSPAMTTLTLTAKGATPGMYTLTVSPYIYSQQITVALKIQ